MRYPQTLPETIVAPETPGLENDFLFWEGFLAGAMFVFGECEYLKALPLFGQTFQLLS